MGRLRTPSASRRGLLRRPLLIFAVLLLGPATGFCILGWRSLEREHDVRVFKMERAAQDVLQQRVGLAAAALERTRERESRRHYYEYQSEFLPREQVASTLAFQSNQLKEETADPYVVGWFQWELFGRHGPSGSPEVLPAGDVQLKRDLVAGYGDALRARLSRAPESLEVLTAAARVESYSQRLVAANEERGQLLEELALQKRQQETTQQADLEQGYVDSFMNRARDAPIRVRYTGFRYLARQLQAPGPPLIAWRVVWVPPEQAQWREVKRDRWILQGYALDPGLLFPAAWEPIGSAEVMRADGLPVGELPRVFRQSLPDLLRAEVVGVAPRPGLLPAVFDPSLTLASRADAAAAEAAWRDARTRFLFLVGALVVVVAAGFGLLVRGIRREIALVRRKEDFIAAITHELKTPLTGIRMYADMLREGWVRTPEAADTYAGRILDETDRLGHLVDQVLDLAALERGVAAVNAQPGDLGEAVRSAVALMETKAQEARVALHTEIAADLPPVAFDPRLVRPLVLNIVDNAIKYSARAETKEVRVRLEQEGERAVLRVEDRGVGITAATRKRLFEPFQRAGDELTREAPGVGIGLTLVKRYADAHRAKLVVSSEPGEGTTVEVRFPI